MLGDEHIKKKKNQVNNNFSLFPIKLFKVKLCLKSNLHHHNVHYKMLLNTITDGNNNVADIFRKKKNKNDNSSVMHV